MLTKILVEIPNDYIDQARDTSDEVNSYLQKEYGVDPNDWTITPKDVLERALGDSSGRYYEEDGELYWYRYILHLREEELDKLHLHKSNQSHRYYLKNQL